MNLQCSAVGGAIDFTLYLIFPLWFSIWQRLGFVNADILVCSSTLNLSKINSKHHYRCNEICDCVGHYATDKQVFVYQSLFEWCTSFNFFFLFQWADPACERCDLLGEGVQARGALPEQHGELSPRGGLPQPIHHQTRARSLFSSLLYIPYLAQVLECIHKTPTIQFHIRIVHTCSCSRTLMRLVPLPKLLLWPLHARLLQPRPEQTSWGAPEDTPSPPDYCSVLVSFEQCIRFFDAVPFRAVRHAPGDQPRAGDDHSVH